MTSGPGHPPALRIVLAVAEAGLRARLSQYLELCGYRVHPATDGAQVDGELAREGVDLVLMDVSLPGEGGLSICSRLFAAGGPPMILLGSGADAADCVLGLELGADDYVSRSCSPRELLARIRAVTRRIAQRPAAPERGRIFRFRGFTLDVQRRELRNPEGVDTVLTAGEFALLQAFLDYPQQILSRDRLLDLAWGRGGDVYDRAIDVQISRLRRKLRTDAVRQIIRTHRSAGYLFDAAVVRR